MQILSPALQVVVLFALQAEVIITPNKDEQPAKWACAIFALGMVDRNVNGFWTALYTWEQPRHIKQPTRAMIG